MISPEHVGRSYPPTKTISVTPSAIAEFAWALGASDPGYFSEEPIAPPTFVAVVWTSAWQAMFADPELEISLRRTIHVSQRFMWDRALRAGDEVQGVLTISNVGKRGKYIMIEFVVEMATVAGEHLVRSESTFYYLPEEGR